jgi:hypothetical protein
LLETCKNMYKCEILKHYIKIKLNCKKVFGLNINLICPRDESHVFFFLKFIFLKLFIGLLKLKIYIF